MEITAVGVADSFILCRARESVADDVGNTVIDPPGAEVEVLEVEIEALVLAPKSQPGGLSSLGCLADREAGGPCTSGTITLLMILSKLLHL